MSWSSFRFRSITIQQLNSVRLCVLFDAGDDDVVVARVTSQSSTAEFDVPISRWRNAGLLAASVTRIHKLATIEKRMVSKKLGRLDDSDWSAAQTAVKRIFLPALNKTPSILARPGRSNWATTTHTGR